MLTIFRLEAARVQWVWGECVDAKVYDAAKGDLPSRPKRFTSPNGRPLYTVLERIQS